MHSNYALPIENGVILSSLCMQFSFHGCLVYCFYTDEGCMQDLHSVLYALLHRFVCRRTDILTKTEENTYFFLNKNEAFTQTKH